VTLETVSSNGFIHQNSFLYPKGNVREEIKKLVNFIAEVYYQDNDRDESNYKITAAVLMQLLKM
jgi:hypothetical protein